MKRTLLLFALLIGMVSINAQTKEELQTQKSEKQAIADAAQAEANALQAKINALPGWKKGAFGTIGGSLSNFSNWYAQDKPNNASGNIGFTVNAFANLIEDKFFWFVIGATSETQAREACRKLDPEILFPFDKADVPQRLNRIQRKKARERQADT